MTPMPDQPGAKNAGHYVWAVVILVLIGALMVVGTLYLHPAADPLEVIGQVLKGLAPTIAGVLAYLKSHDTHLSVNGRLDAFMASQAKIARAEGMAQGALDEQARITATATTIATVQAGAPVPVSPPAGSMVLQGPVTLQSDRQRA